MMIYWKQFLVLIVLLATCRYYIQAANYEIIGDSDYFLQECDKEKDFNTHLHDVFKIDLQHVYSDDMDTVYSTGNITVLSLLRDDLPIQMEVEFYLWSRSEWIPTPYSMRRSDFCRALNDPTEPWAFLMLQVPKDQRVCPPKEGTVYTVANSSNHMVLNHLPSVGVSGKYKIVIHLTQGKNILCLVMYVHIYKI